MNAELECKPCPMCEAPSPFFERGSASGSNYYECPQHGRWKAPLTASELGSLGGKARALALSPERRSEIARTARAVAAENYKKQTEFSLSLTKGERSVFNEDIRTARMDEAKKKGTHTGKQWLALLDFCGRKCCKCGAGGDRVKIVKDHIEPVYCGGSDSIENVQPLCSSCNSQKTADATDYRPSGWREALGREKDSLAAKSNVA